MRVRRRTIPRKRQSQPGRRHLKNGAWRPCRKGLRAWGVTIDHNERVKEKGDGNKKTHTLDHSSATYDTHHSRNMASEGRELEPSACCSNPSRAAVLRSRALMLTPVVDFFFHGRLSAIIERRNSRIPPKVEGSTGRGWPLGQELHCRAFRYASTQPATEKKRRASLQPSLFLVADGGSCLTIHTHGRIFFLPADIFSSQARLCHETTHIAIKKKNKKNERFGIPLPHPADRKTGAHLPASSRCSRGAPRPEGWSSLCSWGRDTRRYRETAATSESYRLRPVSSASGGSRGSG